MKKFRTAFSSLMTVALCCVASAAGHAQHHISLRQIPQAHLLPSNSAPRVLQDSEGFMWFGTLDGLCRYDGYRMMVLRSDLNNPGLLTNNEITCLAEDNNGRIIAGTKTGVDILDKSTYRITRLDGAGVAGEEIKSVAALPDGSIWVGTRRSLFRYDADLILRRHYEDCLPHTSVNSLFLDNDRTLWVTMWQGGLHRYDPETDTFIRCPRIGKTDNPFKLFQDKDSRIWICTWGEGMSLFTPGLENPYRPTPIMTPTGPLAEGRFFSIVQDDYYGYLWVISTTGLHAVEVLPDARLRDVDITGLTEKSNNIFSEIIEDRDGTLWLGSFGETVFTINFRMPAITNYPLDFIKRRTEQSSNVTLLYVDGRSRMWMNQNRTGLLVYDPQRDAGQFWTDIPALSPLDWLNITTCISSLRSNPDVLWIGPENNPVIYCIEADGNRIKHNETIRLDQIENITGGDPPLPRLLHEDNAGNMWIATTRGLMVMEQGGRIPVLVSSAITRATGIAEDKAGNLWISEKTGGVHCVRKSDRQLVRTWSRESGDLPTSNIETVCAHDDRIWIGAKEGNIMTLDPSEGRFTDVSKSFRVSGASIIRIIADEGGHLWVVTSKSVTEYNPANHAQVVYTAADGVGVTSFGQYACFKGDAGRMIFGGNNGLCVLTHSDGLTDSRKAKVIVTDVKAGNRSLLGSASDSRFDPLSQRLTLRPEDKNIEIDFSSFDYLFPFKTQFAYRMEGVDDDWIYTDEDRQFATYNTLGKGWRTFYVKAADENNLWSDEVATMRIYKRPAWWETVWAYCAYIAAGIWAAWFAYATVRNRIRLRNELKISNIEKQKSEELTQTKLRYFTNISHDFLTPLTIMSCVVDDIEMTGKLENPQVGIMRSNISRLKRLLQQVLDFRRVESGNMKLKLSLGDVVKFVREVCYGNFIPLIEKKEIRFAFDAQPEGIEAFFDADKLDKIVFNLLSNAIKYTSPGGTVSVAMRLCGEGEDRMLRISVRDTGCGIPAENLGSVFTRFYTNDLGDPGQTNGVGLSLTKELVEIHQGTIGVESREGEGSTFTVEIPVGRERYRLPSDKKVIELDRARSHFAAEPSGANPRAVRDDSPKDALAKEINILLVEDNEELLGLVYGLLAKSYRVLTARNGAEALESVEANDVSLVISDVMMPVMDGMELCRRLKTGESTSHIPVILLTARNSTEDRIECYNAGADAYISKPFSLHVLEARIQNFIRNRHKRQQEFRAGDELNLSALQYSQSEEQFLRRTIDLIGEHIGKENFDINLLADKLCMSKSTLYRKIKTLTGMSPLEFVRNIKLKHACRLLRDKSIHVSEVAFACGFMTPKYFSTCFREEFGMTPSQYQAGEKALPPG